MNVALGGWSSCKCSFAELATCCAPRIGVRAKCTYPQEVLGGMDIRFELRQQRQDILLISCTLLPHTFANVKECVSTAESACPPTTEVRRTSFASLDQSSCSFLIVAVNAAASIMTT